MALQLPKLRDQKIRTLTVATWHGFSVSETDIRMGKRKLQPQPPRELGARRAYRDDVGEVTEPSHHGT